MEITNFYSQSRVGEEAHSDMAERLQANGEAAVNGYQNPGYTPDGMYFNLPILSVSKII